MLFVALSTKTYCYYISPKSLKTAHKYIVYYIYLFILKGKVISNSFQQAL